MQNTGNSKKTAGRPPQNGTRKDEKLTIYLTASLKADIQDLARIYGKTIPEYISDLVSRETAARADDIQTIRDMRKKNTLGLPETENE